MAILGLGKTRKAKAVQADISPARHDTPRYSEPAPRLGDLTVGDYANGMPRIRLGEFFGSLAKQLKWVLPLMVLGTVGVFYATKDIKRTYSGEGRVLVQLGSEYVYSDVTNQNASQGLLLTPDHIVLNEIGIMKNADIIEKVVGEMTSSDRYGTAFAKDAFEKINAARGPVEEQNAWVDLYKEVESSFAVMPQPKSSIVDLAFRHENPEIAVATLNMFIAEYLEARKKLFVEGSGDAISERRRSTEQQLNANERAIQRFLEKNGVSDFDSERTGVTKRTEDLRTELNTLRGNLTESERGLATVENQLRNTPEIIDQYVDDRTSQRVAAAELELKQLLAKYLPGSQPVRQKEIELAELKSLQGRNGGKAAGGRRVGPNPVYQDLMRRRNTLQAQADSLREKEFTLQRQLDAADNKVRRLQAISPSYQNLLRERATLDTRLKSYTAKEQEAMVNQDQAEASSENVRVISYASRPRKGTNTQLLMRGLGVIGLGFTLFVLALMRVFLDPKLYAPTAVRREGSDRRSGARDADYAAPAVVPAATPYYAPEPYQPAAYASEQMQTPAVPEAVPAPDHAFGATPYVASDATHAAPSEYVPGQGPTEYQPGMNYDYSQQGGAQPYAQSYGGNTAEDLYANPYLQGQAAGPITNTDVPVIGTVPPGQT